MKLSMHHNSQCDVCTIDSVRTIDSKLSYQCIYGHSESTLKCWWQQEKETQIDSVACVRNIICERFIFSLHLCKFPYW